MKRLYIPLLLFLLLVLEGVALDLLPFKITNTMIVPHFVLVFLLLVAIFYDKENTYSAILYSIIFGLLIDVVYTGVLGVYMFGYAGVTYLVRKLKVLMHTNFYVTILLGLIAISFAEIFIYIIYSVIGLTYMPWTSFLFYRLLPTVLANLIFLMMLYPIFTKKLSKWFKENISKNTFL